MDRAERPRERRIDYAGAWRQAWASVRSGYRFLLPGVTWTWFLSEGVSGNLPVPRQIAALLLFPLGYLFYGAGACRLDHGACSRSRG